MPKKLSETYNAAKRKVKAFLLSTASHPLFAVIVTILGVIAGLFGSLYSNQIKENLKRPIETLGLDISVPALFWPILGFFAFMFFGRQWATDEKTVNAQANLIQKTSDLEKFIKTLPPQGFLTRFSELYALCNWATRSALEAQPKTIEIIDSAIRFIMQSVVHLANAFDGQPDGARYAANIMIYFPQGDLSEATKNELRAKLLFCDRDPNQLAG